MTDRAGALPDGARTAWASTRVHVHAGALVLVSLPRERLAQAAALVPDVPFAALVLEPAEVALTLPREAWSREAARFPEARVDGPYRAITLDVELPLDLVGYLAPAAAALAEAGVGIVPQCGYRTDHLLVHEGDVEAATGVLEELVRVSRSDATG